MNAQALSTTQQDWIKQAVNTACERIAPVWSLDKTIAVNPWWKMRSEPMPQVAAKLQCLGNVKMLMDKSYYRSLWQSQISERHLLKAAQLLHLDANVDTLVSYLEKEESPVFWQHLADLLDQQSSQYHKMPWRDEIVHQISQFTALYFQYPDHILQSDDLDNSFYTLWLDVVRQDKGIAILMAESSLNEQFLALPNSTDELFNQAKAMLDVDVNSISLTEYCHALLLDINGWASWMANQSWQAAFANQSSNLLHQLLAVRLAWDIVLWRHALQKSAEKFYPVQKAFTEQFYYFDKHFESIKKQQAFSWVWQTALELSYQQSLQNKLLEQIKVKNDEEKPSTPALHAIFCIDVRSEPMRRALEAQSSSIKTSGFAGFFGLPIEYALAGSDFKRPQLPGLLKANIIATQADVVTKEKESLLKAISFKKHADAAPSTFAAVETKGIFKAFDLLRNSLFPSRPKAGIAPLASNARWTLASNNQALDDAQQAKLALGILKAMNLIDDFSPRVLLVAHASCTSNNPHAAGLDCGACGGQSGEVNVKILAQILNSEAVRTHLRMDGIDIPADTRFMAGLHNTTTDEIQIFDGENQFNSEPWAAWLSAATRAAQKKRAASLGIDPENSAEKTHALFQKQSNDWAQVRPEWGLANNAAFIVAPRSITAPIDLEGRSFLHDYDWKKDTDFLILELIMTAPMVVTNWINLQYYASVTDNQKYGSGNKLLHNVVGGNMGVFEGNGGDLRIGLPIQSLHDGQQWRHQPLRLSVYLAAPREAILNIVNKHAHIKALINNKWLYLFQLDADENNIYQLDDDHWVVTHEEVH